MLYYAIAVFALAAVLGLILMKSIVKNQETPKVVVLLHGLAAASGLGILIYYVIRNPDHNPLVSLVIFGLAALGGFYLLFRDLSKKSRPLGVAVIHMLAAATGLVLLLLFVFA